MAKSQRWQVALDGQEAITNMRKAPRARRVLGCARLTVDAARGVFAIATIALDAESRPFVLSLHFDLGSGSKPEDGGLSTADVRSVSIGALLAQSDEARRTLAEDPALRFMHETPDELASLLSESRPRRRGALSDVKLRRVAELYLREQTNGPGLRRRMASKLRLPENTAEATVRYWIELARRDGWLTKAEHGARRASAGPRLRAYYESKEKGEQR